MLQPLGVRVGGASAENLCILGLKGQRGTGVGPRTEPWLPLWESCPAAGEAWEGQPSPADPEPEQRGDTSQLHSPPALQLPDTASH